VKLSVLLLRSILVVPLVVATVRLRPPLEVSETTIRPSTRFLLLPHGLATDERLRERVKGPEYIAAMLAAMIIGHKAIARLPVLLALLPIATFDRGKGHLPGYICLLKASGEAGSTPLTSLRPPARGKDSAAQRLMGTSTTTAAARTMAAAPTCRRRGSRSTPMDAQDRPAMEPRALSTSMEFEGGLIL
jgi:hypothetical protein